MSIRLLNVTKEYVLKRPRTSQEPRVFPGQVNGDRHTLTAVDNVSLNISRGQSVGLIGRNGSGKSTLLRMIAGIVHPSSGDVRVEGRLSAVLDVQSGLHPRLTGRQNIFLKGAIYGQDRRTTSARVDAIVDFSGLEEFIDYPIYQYSSGMIVRLGFSIAMHMDFDILLLDEFLSVGDVGFQRKCLSGILRFLTMGKTVVLASHSMSDIAAISQRVVLLKNGRLEHDGDAGKVLKLFQESSEGEQSSIPRSRHLRDSDPKRGADAGDLFIRDVRLLDGCGREREVFRAGDPLSVSIRFHCAVPMESPLFVVNFFRDDGLWVHGADTARTNLDWSLLRGEGEILLDYSRIILMEGDYHVTVGVRPGRHPDLLTDIAQDGRRSSRVVRIEHPGKDGVGTVSDPYTWRLKADGLETVECDGTLRMNR